MERPLDTSAEVETPEHVCFRYRVAGPARRSLAYVLDLLLRGFFAWMLWLCLLWIDRDITEGATVGAFAIAFFTIEWGYHVLFESLWSGRTPGKRAMQLRVVKDGGYAVNFVDVVLRNLLRAADILPGIYSVAVLVMGFDSRMRRLGDMVAGTMVVLEDRGRIARGLSIEPPPTAEELGRLPSRPPLSADELDAVELFLRRLGTISPAREVELAEMVAPAFARRMGITADDPVRLLALVHYRATGGRADQRTFPVKHVGKGMR